MQVTRERPASWQKRLVRLFCWLRGHDMLNLYTMSNTANGGSSDWGRHQCQRCGKEVDWQYDR